MPTFGKPVKGSASIKDGKKKKDAMTMEADQLRELELRRKRETLIKSKLQALHQEEAKMSEWSNREIQMRWVDLLRSEKLSSLRKEIEVLAQLHDKTVDRKNAVTDMLFADLDEADEQYRLALRTHLQNVDTLLELQAQRTTALELDFDGDLRELKDEFQRERGLIQAKHEMECSELIQVMAAMKKEAAELDAEMQAEFSQQKDETRDKTSEEYNVLRQGLELEIVDLQMNIQKQHENYLQTAEEKKKQYDELTKKDSDTAERIAIQMRRIQRLQENIANWKANLANNIKECEERNRNLKEEKEQTAKHLKNLKYQMQRWRRIQEEHLNELVEMASSAKKTLKSKAERAERLLRLAELCRSMETERERVLTFNNDCAVNEVAQEMEIRQVASQLEQTKREVMRQAASNASIEDDEYEVVKKIPKPGEKPLLIEEGMEEWELMENFWVKFNKVMLDNAAIAQEKQHLVGENAKLRSLLKQYLDGVSVTQEVMGGKNNLLMTQKMGGTQRSLMGTLGNNTRGNIPVTDANEVVCATAKQRVMMR